MARPTEFESVTFAFGGQRSIQLSYGRIAGRGPRETLEISQLHAILCLTQAAYRMLTWATISLFRDRGCDASVTRAARRVEATDADGASRGPRAARGDPKSVPARVLKVALPSEGDQSDPSAASWSVTQYHLSKLL